MLRNYDRGILTAFFCAMHVMEMIDGSNAESMLSVLPPEILEYVHNYVMSYRPGGPTISINDPRPGPSPEQVAAARRWFDARA